MKTVFVTSSARTWNSIQVVVPDTDTRVRIENDPEFGVGFLAVYETAADALKANPGAQVFPLQVPMAWLRFGHRDDARGDA